MTESGTDQPGDDAAPAHGPPTDAAPAASADAASSAAAEPAAATLPSPFFRLRGQIPRWMIIGAGLLCILLCGLLWWWATRGEAEERLLGHAQLPSIRETVEMFPQMADPEEPQLHLVYNTLVSLKRVVIGFALAALIGIPIGVAAGCFPIVRSFFSPLVLFGRNIPVAALIPLAFALFGTGEGQKYMFIFIACVAFLIADTIDAISEVAQRYVETALTLGASTMQIVFKVLVPLAMPLVFNSIRVMFGLAFGYIMLVELIHEGDGPGGLGRVLTSARTKGYTEFTVTIILTIPVVAYLIDQILYVIQCWLFRWKYGKEAEHSIAFRLSRWVVSLFWKPERAAAAGAAAHD